MPLDQQPLIDLYAECQQQLQRFRLVRARDTSSCAEILRRAAAFDTPATNTLLQITEPLVRTKCPPTLRASIDDWAQDVLLQLAQKLANRESPYALKAPPPEPFAAYRSYVNIACRSTAYDYWEREKRVPAQSLDQLAEHAGYEPLQVTDELDALHRRLRMERLLVLIPKPRDREIFRLRFVAQLTTDEAVAALEQQGVVVTRKEVLRSVERTIVALSKIPEVRELFEAEEGNSV